MIYHQKTYLVPGANNLRLNPKPVVMMGDVWGFSEGEGTRKHFLKLNQYYGDFTIVNLLDQFGNESELCHYFSLQSALHSKHRFTSGNEKQQENKQEKEEKQQTDEEDKKEEVIPLLRPAPKQEGVVDHYIAYYFHEECSSKHGGYEAGIKKLLRVIQEKSPFSAPLPTLQTSLPTEQTAAQPQTISQPTPVGTVGQGLLEKYGFFAYDEDLGLLNKQTGVIRTNCLDCLDRTNVVQCAIAIYMLENHQLPALPIHRKSVNQEGNVSTNPKVGDLVSATSQVLKPSRTISLSKYPFVLSNVRVAWADNADHMSRGYTGTGALKTEFTRTGKRSVRGQVTDGYNSARRLIQRAYRDEERQNLIDSLLGKIQFCDYGSTMIPPVPNSSFGKTSHTVVQSNQPWKFNDYKIRILVKEKAIDALLRASIRGSTTKANEGNLEGYLEVVLAYPSKIVRKWNLSKRIRIIRDNRDHRSVTAVFSQSP